MGKENDCYDSSVKMFTLKQQQILANVKLTKVIVTMFIDRVATMTAVCLTVGFGPRARTDHRNEQISALGRRFVCPGKAFVGQRHCWQTLPCALWLGRTSF